jgi:hypothetical protein
MQQNTSLFFLRFLFLVGPGFELRALPLKSRRSGAGPSVHPAPVVLEMGSREPFACSALEPGSSRPQPPERLGLQACATAPAPSAVPAPSVQILPECLSLWTLHPPALERQWWHFLPHG